MKTKPIPDGFESAIPYLICKDAAQAIEFYKRAFGATEHERIAMPDGRVGHAELKIGGATIMLADEFPDMGTVSPQSLGGTTVRMMVYVADVDAFAAHAAAAGAKVLSAHRRCLAGRNPEAGGGVVRGEKLGAQNPHTLRPWRTTVASLEFCLKLHWCCRAGSLADPK